MPRSPDFDLSMMNKITDEKVHHIGAAWKNEDGSISIVLNRFVVLPADPQWVINLFPKQKA